jgi:hypothetical protein
MNITEDFINIFAGNPKTVSNGRALASKGSFTLNETEDGALIFGTCKGSGKSSYNCSVDFSDSSSPIARCTCPSRQIPCKHAVALLFHKLNGDMFTIGDIPEDIAVKREKKAKRESKAKSNESTSPVMTKAKANAAAKKCRAQLEGIAMAEKMLNNMLKAGLHSIDRENQNLYASQVKELGNYYIGGVQSAFVSLLSTASKGQLSQVFTESIEKANFVYTLLKNGKSYLESKLADYEAFPELPNAALDQMLNSRIEEQLGYAWKLSELRDNGLFVENAELMQLSFDSYDDRDNKQVVDEGVWMILNTGAIVYTFNYRPYKAMKNINPSNSFFKKMGINNLYMYPGEKNPRVRWDDSSIEDTSLEDFQKVISFARGDYAQVVKEVKSQIINPLADKHPVFSLRVSRMYSTEDPSWNAVADESGSRIMLSLEKFGYLLNMASQEQVETGALACRFTYDTVSDLLYAVPLSLVTNQGVIRFFY